MNREDSFVQERRAELCLALTGEKEEALTYDILWYEMLILNLTEESLPQVSIQMKHSRSVLLVPDSVSIQSVKKLGEQENHGTSFKKEPKESILLAIGPYGREIIRFGFYITMQGYEEEISVSCIASLKERNYSSNSVKTRIIATTGIPCLIKQSFLLPAWLPKTVTIGELNVYYQHQKSTFLPGIVRRKEGELCHHTRLLFSGVLFYSLTVRYSVGIRNYEETLEYMTGYTQGNILPEGALYAKPESKLSLYSTDVIQVEGRIYSCSFGFLFFLP